MANETLRNVALTTTDNPWDPFTQFDEWNQFDHIYGYNSNELLARFAKTSDALSDEDNILEIERAINKILDLDFQGIYIKFHEGDKILINN